MIVLATGETIRRAGEIIRAGGLVAFPTETVYGLGASALDPAAVERIYQAKQRPFASPLIVHVADDTMARTLALDWPPLADVLARRFWPGALTLIVRKAELVPDLVTAGLDSIGIRIPAHPVALALIRAAGVPIAAPSANLFAQVSPTTAQHVAHSLAGRVDLILDGGSTSVGIESTVVTLRRSPPAVLRPGMLSLSELESATGITWEREIDRPHVVDEPAEAPGQQSKHYAPRTPFYVLSENVTLRAGNGHVIPMPADRHEYARHLYARLRQADTEGWDWIAVEKPPETPDWTGIWDRLNRASSRH